MWQNMLGIKSHYACYNKISVRGAVFIIQLVATRFAGAFQSWSGKPDQRTTVGGRAESHQGEI